jgi:Right handed beta helix region
MKNQETPFCSPSGACIDMMPPQCVDSDGCAQTPLTPICDTDVGMCKGCDEVDDQDACEALQEGAVPYCAGDGSCAACLEHDHCGSDAPVCDPDAKTCGACKQHSDCVLRSDVCGGDGKCIPASEVVYVAKSGSDNGDCIQGAPCASLPYARDKVQTDNLNKHVIRILDADNYAGTAGGAFTLSGIDVTIFAVGATLTSIDNNRPVIDIGVNTDLTLDGVIVNTNASGADGVRCQSSDSRVTLQKVTVTGNRGVGINVSGGCELIADRSLISGNLGGGIKILGAPFTITNNYILDNGGTSSSFGGIQILNSDGGATQVLAFNTIWNNNASSTADTRGVDCDLPGGSPLTATSNILRGGSGGLGLLKRDNCDWVYSSIEGLPVDLMRDGNIDDACNLTPDAANLPRIDAVSMCKESGEPGTGIGIDYDGDLRPDGSDTDKPDIGADEYFPPAP